MKPESQNMDKRLSAIMDALDSLPELRSAQTKLEIACSVVLLRRALADYPRIEGLADEKRCHFVQQADFLISKANTMLWVTDFACFTKNEIEFISYALEVALDFTLHRSRVERD